MTAMGCTGSKCRRKKTTKDKKGKVTPRASFSAKVESSKVKTDEKDKGSKFKNKRSSPTSKSTSFNLSLKSDLSVKRVHGPMVVNLEGTSTDDFFAAQKLEFPWTPHMTPTDFENVRKIWYLVGRRHQVIPMVNYMLKAVFTAHPETRFLTKGNYQAIIYSSRDRSMSNLLNFFNRNTPNSNSPEMMDMFLSSHIVYFWRTINSIISHRKDSSWGVDRLTELYIFHRNIYLKTGVPTKRHFQTFLEAWNEYLHKSLRHQYENDVRESFHRFINVIYYFMNYCEPDMKPWCETYT